VNSLEVRHISFSSSGGAGKVAKTLNDNLIRLGYNSDFFHIAVGDIRSAALRHPFVFTSGLIDFYLVRQSRSQSLFSLYRGQSSLDTHKLNSKVVHLHWTPGTVSQSDIRTFSNLKLPMIWTLHDMFPFTGGCHHAMECTNYRIACSSCPQVRPFFQKKVKKSLRNKIETSQIIQPISIVTPSVWLGHKAEESQIFKNSSVTVIPNPVDTNFFKPNLPSGTKHNHKFTVGCSATNLLDPMKGVLSIISVLEIFQSNNPGVEVELLAIGGGKLPASKIAIRQAGFVSDQSKIVNLYQEMDVFVSMSLAEVFPLSIAEAQSCGVPVICLNSGGMPEMVEPGVNGFVAKTPDEMLHFLTYFSQNSERAQVMRAESRLHAVSRYSTNVVVNKYLDLYSRVMNK
jgi:glycosyltransferase involved in cell wall biosynthesis